VQKAKKCLKLDNTEKARNICWQNMCSRNVCDNTTTHAVF